MLELRSSALLVTVLPEVGGKVAQIQDRASGHDLLVAPRRPYRTIPLDGDWLEHDTSGMDDCFPNVAQGFYPQAPWASTYLPDLGEWTHGVWNIAEADAAKIILERHGSALPYFARKSIRMTGERSLAFSYRVENRGEAPIRYLWSAHPLIAAPDGFRLETPPGRLTYRTFPSEGETSAWPDYRGINLSRQWIGLGTSLKIFVNGLSEGWCTLHLATASFRFTFDLQSIPVVGIWFNNYGFPTGDDSFRCIAVEPCTSPSDLLDELAPAAYPTIAPGQAVEWDLGLEISASDSADTQ